MQTALFEGLYKEREQPKQIEEKPHLEMSALDNPKQQSRVLRMTGGGVQGREESSCMLYLPGFKCKGKYLENQGQPKHLTVWQY